jgi:S-adenosylmethionine decarboxylase
MGALALRARHGYALAMRTTVGVSTGRTYWIDAYACDPARLRDVEALRAVVRRAIAELELHLVGEPVWHRFPGEGGVTGFAMLSESHLSVHTFPETGFAAFDLYCCRERPRWRWKRVLAEALGARRVVVRSGLRGGAATR